jgi:hypothetical protein
MPRSYSFDHFQVPAAEPRSRSLRRKDKQHVAGTRQEAEPREEGIHYGRSHAQTEALFHAHARERQQAQMTEGAEPHAGGKFAHAHPAVEHPAAPAREREVHAPVRRGTVPIGALPGLEEPPPRGRLRDLLDEASRQVQVLQGSVNDAARAAGRLASLPMEVVRLAARRLHLVHG